MKKKLQKLGSRLSLLWVLALALMVGAFTTVPAWAVFTPTEVDPTDAISQVTATAGDVLPYVMALAAAGIVFRLIRKWIR